MAHLLTDFDGCFCPDEFRPYPFYNDKLTVTADYSKLDVNNMVSNPDLLDMDISTILGEIENLIVISNENIVTKLIGCDMDLETEAYLDTIYQYLDTIVVKALKSESDSRGIFLKSIDGILNLLKNVRGKMRKAICARFTFYLSYYFVLVCVKNSNKQVDFVVTTREKITDFVNNNHAQYLLNENEIVSYGNFFDTMIDVHKQII